MWVAGKRKYHRAHFSQIEWRERLKKSRQKAATLQELANQIHANHKVHSDWFVQIDKKSNGQQCVLYHVLDDKGKHILKRTPNRPISFYDCNERKNFFLRSKNRRSETIDRKKPKKRTGVNSLQNPKAARSGNIQCTVYLFRFCFSLERNWPTHNKKIPFPSNYLMRSEHLWEENQTIYFRLPPNIIKHFIFVHLFCGRCVA